jgi:D-inositol-3-phosphate glycosyltransferase
MLSAHTSPLAQPGSGDAGGMNVYVLSLASALARSGVECDVLTRASDTTTPSVVEVESGLRVMSLEAGPRRPLTTDELETHLGALTTAAAAYVADSGRFDAIHAHYWASGAVGHALKHTFDLPLVTTFHTLAQTKVTAGLDEPAERIRLEHEVVRCSDRLVASTQYEAADLVADYGAEPERIEVVPPGVDHAMFFPGDRDQARRRVRLPSGPWIVFVGRIQPLKGVDVALRSLALLDNEHARLAVVGGPSGPDGDGELERLRHLATELGVEERVRWVAPRPHAALADWYRAADVCVVPSRTESFGLVALEAAACGRPVVAANVGGLRSLIDDGSTGFLVEGRDPLGYVAAIDRLLAEPDLAATMGSDAAARSLAFTWSMTAARLRRLYADLGARDLVRCS